MAGWMRQRGKKDNAFGPIMWGRCPTPHNRCMNNKGKTSQRVNFESKVCYKHKTQNALYLHERIFLVAVKALPLGRPMYYDVHLVVFTIHRLVATFIAAEPAALIRVQRDIKCNAIEKHLSYQTSRPVYFSTLLSKPIML